MTLKHDIKTRFSLRVRTALQFLCLTLVFGGFVETARAQVSAYPPLNRSNFTSLVGTAPGSELGDGFNDRQNSWAWSMLWFKGKLFVGTNRAQQCVNAAAIHNQFPSAEPYPPTDPDISCNPDYTSLPLQAEIWSWDPATKLWTEVYQAPADIPIPNTNPVKYVSRDIGYRGMLQYTESDGTQALYVGSCSSRVLYGTAVPPGRILRTTDGVSFNAIPQDSGTYLGNIGSACFRGSQQYNGKFYGVATDFQGAGILIESANPQLGDNSFRQVSPLGVLVYEFSAYNNALYVSFSSDKGFSIYKTTATGNLPYTYTLIFANGGYKTSYPNHDALSMKQYKGRLYIGGNGVQSSGTIQDVGAELFRVNPDDSWDLVVGASRSTPAGQKNALSGLGVGFGWNLNEHMWRLEVYDGRLYVGTFDASTVLRNNTQLGPSLQPELGADLWYSSDGTYFSNVDYQGFENKFNFGFRSIVATPVGLFVGTANYFYGLEVWEGIPTGLSGAVLGPVGSPSVSTVPDSPSSLQLETTTQSTLLSWQPSQHNASKYLVYRWNTTPIQPTLPPLSGPPIDEALQLFQAVLAGYGTGVGQGPPLQIPSTRVLIGTTTKTIFADSTAASGATYAYEVIAENTAGGLSGPSNVAGLPSQLPKSAFPDVWTLLAQYAAQSKFSSPATQQAVTTLINQAQTAAATGNFAPLITAWQTLAASGGTLLNTYSAQDLTTLLELLVGRSQLIAGGLLPAGSI